MAPPVTPSVISSVVRPKENVPVRDWPAKASVAAETWNCLTSAAPSKTTATPGSVLPGISMLVFTAWPVVLIRTLVVPVTVTPGTPMRLTVPVATKACPVPIETTPMVASVSSTPTASGLTAPESRKAGPRPRKMLRPLPANTCAGAPPTTASL